MRFIEKPFVPKGRVTLAIVDPRMPEGMKEFLNSRGVATVDAFMSNQTYKAISGHPDISFFYLGNGKAVVSPESLEHYEKKLSEYGIKVQPGLKNPGFEYPDNICYNIAIVGNSAIHKFSHTDRVLLEHVETINMEKIYVKQGYSKCSICIAGEDTIITADEKIHAKSMEHGMKSLLIEQGGVFLDGFEYGFIGGCSGMISSDEIFFCGDLSDHANYRAIENFLDRNGKRAVFVESERLVDVGSVIPVMEEL